MGRPLGLGDDTFDLRLPQMTDAQLQLVSSNTISDEFNDIATMSYSIQTFKMVRLISRIKAELYRLPGKVGLSTQPADVQNGLRLELDRWLAESTSVISTTVPESQRLRLSTKLQIHYQGAMALLYQPSQAITHPSEDSLKICFACATKRLQLYETLYDSGALCHSWRTVQDMFLAGATIMYCVSISPAVRNSVSILSLSKDFRACSSMLSVGGEWWPAIRKAKNSLERLSNHILEMLTVASKSDEERRSGRQPFPDDYMPGLETWGAPEATGPNDVQQMLLNVVNHDGILIDFFDDSLTKVLMDGLHDRSGLPDDLDPAFWGQYDHNANLDYQYGGWE
ncbi:hypothetical protein ONS95_010212 [Cadophora gregata]|uniref:uncharacterized protein n=1 Tax=Cadophora gregata TaxID=51156 RepID=UPI0026DB2DB5|nr:uncharacterized protein ONS95_010212 [Cadophora gregata]KAK0121938.1 hypothetical protein ONS95_010212 [Cadophora gregata]KAK0127418.1 hypothetical protein ONS96_006960 [Cadophora gregata f. sp. sojae]